MSVFKKAQNFKDKAVPNGRHIAIVAGLFQEETLAGIKLNIEAPDQSYDGEEVISYYCSDQDFHIKKLLLDCKTLGLKSPLELERHDALTKINGIRLCINVKYKIKNGKEYVNVDFISNETEKSKNPQLSVLDLVFDFSGNGKAGE